MYAHLTFLRDEAEPRRMLFDRKSARALLSSTQSAVRQSRARVGVAYFLANLPCKGNVVALCSTWCSLVFQQYEFKTFVQ